MDECVGPMVARRLREEGHEVFSVFEEARGATDEDIVRKAHRENWILITSDKDFGEKVFREGRPHSGIVLLRLRDERPAHRMRTILRVVRLYADRLAGRFSVVTEDGVRFAGGGARIGGGLGALRGVL